MMVVEKSVIPTSSSSATQKGLVSDLDLLVGFFAELQVCIDAQLCDASVTNNYFSVLCDASVLRARAIHRLEEQILLSRLWRRVEEARVTWREALLGGRIAKQPAVRGSAGSRSRPKGTSERSMFGFREFTEMGGLISYGLSNSAMWRTSRFVRGQNSKGSSLANRCGLISCPSIIGPSFWTLYS